MRRRWSIIFLAIGILAISYLLRDVMNRAVILPLAYLWWLLKLYYRAVPQLIMWVLLIVTVFIAAIRSVSPKNPFRRSQKSSQKPIVGPVEEFSRMLHKAPGGVYYKWLIANRLGNVARELLDQREGRRSRGFMRLLGRDWNPPAEVGGYLESGLNGSFADFPQPHWWTNQRTTPLDMDPGQVINYLEDEMETRHDRDRKGI